MNDHADTLREIRARTEYRLREAQGRAEADPIRKQLAALDATIAALEAGRSAEPVAWMYEHDGSNAAPTFTRKRWMRSGEPWTETPLYAAAPQQPPPIGQVSRVMVTDASALRELLFDGPAVYDALTDEAKRRTGPENVSDVLDALNHASLRSHQQPAPSVSEGPRYSFGPDKSWVQADLSRDPGYWTAPVSEPAASGEGMTDDDALKALQWLAWSGHPKGYDHVKQAVEHITRRLTTTGQGDVERLVDELRWMRGKWSWRDPDAIISNAIGHEVREWMARVDEALAPFGQQEDKS